MAMQKQESDDGYEHAATVMLLAQTGDGIKTLLLKRNPKLKFAGGSWVFPGGRIDPSDVESGDNNNQLLAAKNAAVRETLEETSLKIRRDDLIYFSRWTPPPIGARRFNTWFFLAPVTESEIQKVSVDGGEIHEHRWLAAGQGLSEHAAGKLAMMPPTYVSLAAINRFSRLDDVFTHYSSCDPFHFNPRLDRAANTDEQTVILYEGDEGYALADSGRRGQQHRVVITGGVIEYFCDVAIG